MICPNCHAQIGEGCSFCPNCGFPLRQAEGSAGIQQTAPFPAFEGQPEAAGQAPQRPPEGAGAPPQCNSAFEGGEPAPGAPFTPGPAPKNRRKLSAIEIWVIVIGVCALIALIISIINAAHIETIKNALIEVIQNLQSMSN
ncbi:MAG: zinc-ribbon domain-containing protein [Aeriscardovia sp.]|nr:zinc-ribbon domain-containing protein [Aeriscardovia sp.]